MSSAIAIQPREAFTRPPTPEQMSGMTLINSYDFTDVRERILEEGLVAPSQIDEAIEEFRKFLSLIRRGYQGLAMCSRVVDEVWHTFILFTYDYATFCSEVFGTFLHHFPKTSRSPISSGAADRFRQAYATIYGPLPEVWGGAREELATCDEKCAPSTGDGDCDTGAGGYCKAN